MKKIEINKLENIEGGSFWGGFCGTFATLGGVAVLAVEVGAVIPGVNVLLGVAAVGCGIWAISN